MYKHNELVLRTLSLSKTGQTHWREWLRDDGVENKLKCHDGWALELWQAPDLSVGSIRIPHCMFEYTPPSIFMISQPPPKNQSRWEKAPPGRPYDSLLFRSSWSELDAIMTPEFMQQLDDSKSNGVYFDYDFLDWVYNVKVDAGNEQSVYMIMLAAFHEHGGLTLTSQRKFLSMHRKFMQR